VIDVRIRKRHASINLGNQGYPHEYHQTYEHENKFVI
jgi:hypothetical protein